MALLSPCQHLARERQWQRHCRVFWYFALKYAILGVLIGFRKKRALCRHHLIQLLLLSLLPRQRWSQLAFHNLILSWVAGCQKARSLSSLGRQAVAKPPWS